MLGEEQVFVGSVIQRRKGLHPAAATAHGPGMSQVAERWGAVGDADGEARRVIACRNRHAELRSGGRGPNPAAVPAPVEHHPRQVPGIAVPDNLRRRRIERKQAPKRPLRSDPRREPKRCAHRPRAESARRRTAARASRRPHRPWSGPCRTSGIRRPAGCRPKPETAREAARRPASRGCKHRPGNEPYKDRPQRHRPPRPALRRRRSHRAGHAVDQCTRLPGPVPTHSGLPDSHLQPQDHPVARRRTGFVPVVRTVPAAAPEEQRKDEQDTYRMTDRKHGATGNAG